MKTLVAVFVALFFVGCVGNTEPPTAPVKVIPEQSEEKPAQKPEQGDVKNESEPTQEATPAEPVAD